MTGNAQIPAAGAPMQHFVRDDEFDPASVEKLTPEQEKIFFASQTRLMWWKFKKHKMALWSGVFLIILYGSILISEFLAPYGLNNRHVDYIHAPSQSIHLFHEGSFVGPFVYGTSYKLDMENLRRVYKTDTSKVQKVRFFCRGESYKYWGFWKSDLHLFCPAVDGTLFLHGTDRLGRDVMSRMVYGARISLTIGLLGITISFILGISIGGIAGYYGGMADMVIQRVIEVLQSIPSVPLWLALAAIMPVTWSPLIVYFGITQPVPQEVERQNNHDDRYHRIK